MAMDSDDIQIITDAVLSAIRTNSKTISQLTPVQSLSDTDSFEVEGGKRIAYNVLRTLISTSSQDEIKALVSTINKAKIKSVETNVFNGELMININTGDATYSCALPEATMSAPGLLSVDVLGNIRLTSETANRALSKANANEAAINTLLGDSATEAIDNFNEVIAFLRGVKDNEQLVAILSELQQADRRMREDISTVAANADDARAMIDDMDAELSMLESDTNNFKRSLGVCPYTGAVGSEGGLSGKDVGSVWFVASKRAFAQVTDTAPNYRIMHNTSDEPPMAREDVIYRNGATFYVYKMGVLREYADTDWRNEVRNAITELRAEDDNIKNGLSVHKFTGFVDAVTDLNSDKAVGTIWYVKSECKFYAVETNGVAEAPHYNDAQYNSPREDALFLNINEQQLYYFNGEELLMWQSDLSHRQLSGKQDKLQDSADVVVDGAALVVTDEAKQAVFNDIFNESCIGSAGVCGKYDPNNAPDTEHPYSLNGLWLSYTEAVQVVQAGRISPDTNAELYAVSTLRTNLPPRKAWNMQQLNSTFTGCSCLEVAIVPAYSYVVGGLFNRCVRLRKIIGRMRISTPNTIAFNDCPLLESFTLELLMSGTGEVSFQSSPLLDYTSVKSMVESKLSKDNNITLTFHADVYAKLTGDTTNAAAAALTPEELAQWQAVLTTAVSKNITIATN